MGLAAFIKVREVARGTSDYRDNCRAWVSGYIARQHYNLGNATFRLGRDRGADSDVGINGTRHLRWHVGFFGLARIPEAERPYKMFPLRKTVRR